MEQRLAEEILTGLQDGLFQTYAFCGNGNRLCLLGQGSSSYVYEMYEKNNPGKHYALKIIGLKGGNLPGDKFIQMCRLQQRASDCSSNVAEIIAGAVVELPSALGGLTLQCILMEKLDGVIKKDLSGKTIYARKELEALPERIRLVKQIAGAVASLHREGILHRDIKLENIFYDKKTDSYKLGDFSVSTYTETGNADSIIYTNGYGAPEIERRTGESYDNTADIYSLGITIYLLLNHLKFPGSGGYCINPAQYREDFLFPACEEGTAEWTPLIRKMCSYYKAARCQSMEEVLSELARITDGCPEQAAADDTGLYANGSTVQYREEPEEAAAKYDRYEKKGIVSGILYYYKSRSWRDGVLLSALFALILGTMQPGMTGIPKMGWQSQLMLCLAVIEVILLCAQELHILFGVGAFCAGIWFMLSTEQYVLYAVWLLGILYGIPMVGIAGAAGTILWNLLAYFEKEAYLEFIPVHRLEWVLVTLALLVIQREILLRRECSACSFGKELTERILYYAVPVLCVLIGILAKYTNVFQNPQVSELLDCAHFGRAGLVVLAVNIIDYAAHRNNPRVGEYMWNEYMDKRRH